MLQLSADVYPEMLNEAKISRPRPRPEPWGRGRDRGQFFEAGTEAKAKINDLPETLRYYWNSNDKSGFMTT